MSTNTRYAIGIDLGTTNSSLAFIDTTQEQEEVKTFQVPQVVQSGEVSKRSLLPSALYLPGEHELAEGSIDLPWEKAPSGTVGTFAREQGATIPHRLVSSAKSWLCHRAVDRRGSILPWGEGEDVTRISPIDASSKVLAHFRDAWNHTMTEGDEKLRLENQQVVITVPASFDAVARDLTVEAAHGAGIKNLTLLEEPQSAIYSWIGAQDEDWRRQVSLGDVILVVDIGGGTSDFSLVAVEEVEGDLTLRRIAVGNHIMLGGDNFDLALARHVEASLGMQFTPWQLSAAWHSCQAGKELILNDQSIDEVPIVIPGRGSGLVGGTIRGTLTRDQVMAVTLDGFFPEVKSSDKPVKAKATGLQEIGLPYESDPAITKHLAAFLAAHAGDGQKLAHPTAILWNGGPFKAEIVRERVLSVLSSWVEEDGGEKLRSLDGFELDLAVARGAARYGVVRRGDGIRIRGGTARAYYVGVEVPMPAVPGLAPPVRAVCVAPFGMEEGTSASLAERQFGLTVGEEASFRFFSSSTRLEDEMGQAIDNPTNLGIDEIAPIETTLQSEVAEEGTVIPVTLRSEVTETGTLQIWAVTTDEKEKFRLEFRIRDEY